MIISDYISYHIINRYFSIWPILEGRAEILTPNIFDVFWENLRHDRQYPSKIIWALGKERINCQNNQKYENDEHSQLLTDQAVQISIT